MSFHDPHLRDVLRETGTTFRQLDYWTRKGYLTARIVGPDGYITDDELRERPNRYNPTTASGYRRRWSREEIATATLMRKLVDCGLTVEAAHRAARGNVNGRSEIGPGIVLVLGGEAA